MDQNEEFISAAQMPTLDRFEIKHKAPSNIALVKYWGKHASQLPANASISFTLSQALTATSVVFEKTSNSKVHVLFEGSPARSFEPKIEQFLDRIRLYCPFLKGYSLYIDTSNTFPHSSGIASSASGMAALAMAVVSLEYALGGLREKDKKRKASFLARLGSGSAARSIEGPIVSWGEHPELLESSDLYASRFEQANSIFQSYHDTILIVHKGSKKVSSTLGHNLMNGHVFKEARFEQANSHMSTLIDALKKGNLDTFIRIVESEALSLHAMMMTSSPYFILMEPQTLSVIRAIWAFREETAIPLCFTLDAGANVHLLYPDQWREPVQQFIEEKLKHFCENQLYISDFCGTGAN